MKDILHWLEERDRRRQAFVRVAEWRRFHAHLDWEGYFDRGRQEELRKALGIPQWTGGGKPSPVYRSWR